MTSVLKLFNSPFIGLPTQVNFELNAVKHIDLPQLDHWLFEVFKVEQSHQILTTLSEGRDNFYQQFVVRGLCLLTHLLQSASIPCFIHPVVESVRSISLYRFAVSVYFPPIESLDKTTIERSLSPVFSTLFMMNNTPYSDQVLSDIYQLLNDKLLPILKPHQLPGYSTMALLQQAFKLGMPFKHLGYHLYRLGRGRNQRLIERSSNDADSVIGLHLSRNKYVTAEHLRRQGLPAANHKVVSNFEQAKSAVESLGWPVVVKPLEGNRGEGVSVGVINDVMLKSAMNLALTSSTEPYFLVEKQVVGVCHRLLIIDQKLIYAVKRLARGVQGDGRRTLSELMDADCQKELRKLPWKRQAFIQKDDQALESIKKQGVQFDSIIDDGQWIDLREIESGQWGGRDEDVKDIIHPENLQIVFKTAKAFQLSAIGIDLIIADISQPWYLQGAIINEINYAPMFGAGEVARAAIPRFLTGFIANKGQLPIVVFVGGDDAWQQAKQRQAKECAVGSAVFLTSHNQTIDACLNDLKLMQNGLIARVEALFSDREVEMLIIVVQNDEILTEGLPVDVISELYLVDGGLLLDHSKKRLVEHCLRELLV